MHGLSVVGKGEIYLGVAHFISKNYALSDSTHMLWNT